MDLHALIFSILHLNICYRRTGSFVVEGTHDIDKGNDQILAKILMIFICINYILRRVRAYFYLTKLLLISNCRLG